MHLHLKSKEDNQVQTDLMIDISKFVLPYFARMAVREAIRRDPTYHAQLCLSCLAKVLAIPLCYVVKKALFITSVFL